MRCLLRHSGSQTSVTSPPSLSFGLWTLLSWSGSCWWEMGSHALGFLLVFLLEHLRVEAGNMEPIYWNSLNRSSDAELLPILCALMRSYCPSCEL
ncbi:hypothetical protein NFI96_022221 [Prochilodus magdalenae]|nr:hypothetical protein NFI96_022221 [Prochilodus magdalenae]